MRNPKEETTFNAFQNFVVSLAVSPGVLAEHFSGPMTCTSLVCLSRVKKSEIRLLDKAVKRDVLAFLSF